MPDWPLWHRLLDHARGASRLAYAERATGRTITYVRLVDAVAAAADGPAVEVLRAGNTIDFVVRFLAAMHAGRRVLPADGSVPAAEIDRLLALNAADDRPGPAVLLASSGTTGRPKLVRRGRDALDSVARMMTNAIGLTPGDRVLAAVPLSHSYGLEHGLLAPLWAGATTLLTGGLDLPAVASAWREATVVPAVPSMLEMLLRGRVAGGGCVRRVYTAGAPLPPSVSAAMLNDYHLAVGQVYGMTEIGSAVVHDPARDTAGTVGRACDGVSLRITGDGELLVRSPGMLGGYAGEPLALDDGHFATGDLATLSPNGEVTLIGRRRLLIDVGGAKVNPQEVEAVLGQHPAVSACVVLPLKLSDTVRRVRAIVVPHDVATPPDAADLRTFLRERLAKHKVPRLIEFADDLPRTAAGKVQRHLLETA